MDQASAFAKLDAVMLPDGRVGFIHSFIGRNLALVEFTDSTRWPYPWRTLIHATLKQALEASLRDAQVHVGGDLRVPVNEELEP